MLYKKPPLNHNEQLNLLISRGLIIADKKAVLHCLRHISYYRFSAYCLPFKHGDLFIHNTTFEDIIDLYTFDRKLRLLILEVIEAIEIAVRSQAINQLSEKYGTFGYLNSKYFISSRHFNHEKWLAKINASIDESSEEFIGHHKTKYCSQKEFPIWKAFEVISFGALSRLFQGLQGKDSQAIASQYGLHDVILLSWLHVIVYIRNLCAHHARLWNRKLTFKPKLPNKDKKWENIQNDRIYCLLMMMQYLLQYINPNSTWQSRLINLLEEHPNVSLKSMGFPVDWKENKLWKKNEISFEGIRCEKELIA